MFWFGVRAQGGNRGSKSNLCEPKHCFEEIERMSRLLNKIHQPKYLLEKRIDELGCLIIVIILFINVSHYI